MSNQLLTPSMITKESLRVLHNNLVFVKGTNREYDKQFAVTGAKIGNVINIRKPNRYYVRDGAALQVQQTQETYTSLTLGHQWGVDVNFSTADLTLSLDDFSERILTPAMAKLASYIDMQGLALYKSVYNCVGTPGTTPGSGTGGSGLAVYTTPQIYLNAGMVLDNSAAPRDGKRRALLNPAAQASSVAGLSGLYNAQSEVGEQYRKGIMGYALGFEFAMDQNINVFTCGTRTASASVAIQANVADGATTVVTKTGTGTVKEGDVFTIAGVYGVNPENQQSTGLLQQFVCTEDVTLAGTADTIKISPEIRLIGAAVANGTVTKLPLADDAVTFVGAASTATPQNMAYHRDAFTLGTADLELPRGVEFAGRETYDGVSMRIVRQYDINNDAIPCRIDVLGGWACLRPELACRMAG